jgi:predicted transcriptional regulator YheO
VNVNQTKHLHPTLKFACDLAPALAKALGPGYEIVVHDLSRPLSSIIAIAGNVTNRKVGGPVTDLGLRVLKEGRTDEHLFNYRSQTADGRILRSSSLFIHDSGRAIGCICINRDVTSWLHVKGLISEMCRTEETHPLEETAESYPIDIDELLQTTLDRAVQETGKLPPTMSRDDKIAIVHSLNAMGMFQIRGAASYVADRLAVSRHTIYNYLNEDLE